MDENKELIVSVPDYGELILNNKLTVLQSKRKANGFPSPITGN